METSESRLSQDVVFDILSSPRRRYVLYYLRQTGEPVQLTDLAEQVAAWENETDPSEITEQERKRVYVSLYQTHIPRLDEVGIVDYDQDSGMIVLSEDAEHIDEYLVTSEETTSWQQFYLILAVVSGLVLGLTVFEVSVFGALSETIAAGLVILAFAVTALVHTAIRVRRRRSIPSELQDRS